MAKAPRPKRQIDTAELRTHLVEQISFLDASSAAFDAGNSGEAKRLALTIRVLLHETKHSKSLLKQLGFDKIKFVSTAFPFNRRNLMTHWGLLRISLDDHGARYLPHLGDGQSREVSFDEWWNEIVFKDQGGDAVSRKDLILTAANQDGGGHVDPALDGQYDKLVRENSLGWFVAKGADGIGEPMGDPTKAAIRQIAYEALHVLRPLTALAATPFPVP